ncbi:unnamed protein product [Rangifer tarandus platyrhynchus]|uniref:Uncharacterized protein n=2 Tax=Rangifer tarandus platyrhynchus TaxID=3082113 RepID=A0ACB0EP17_RANTA|nr:unnamed protein product [Rangifer tarandus platyrhynchus]CAI9701954.1 unnamed protein product [Rangifer tarandus platyrhynchus]
MLSADLSGRGRPRGARIRGRLKPRSGVSSRAAAPAGKLQQLRVCEARPRANEKCAGRGGAGQKPLKCAGAGCFCGVRRGGHSMAVSDARSAGAAREALRGAWEPHQAALLVSLRVPEEPEGSSPGGLAGGGALRCVGPRGEVKAVGRPRGGRVLGRPLRRPGLPSSAPAAASPPAPAANDVFASRAGRGGELIPHVECVSQTLLHVHQWDPDGEAEILIFGRPYYQQDVSKMIMNLADYHHQLRARSTRMGTMTGILGRPWVLGRGPDASRLCLG